MSFLSTSVRASLVLLLLAGAPRAGCASAAAGPAPGTPVVARATTNVPGQEPTSPPASQPAPAAPSLTLWLGPLQLRYQPNPDHATLLDRLLFRSRVVALARQVARGNGPHRPF